MVTRPGAVRLTAMAARYGTGNSGSARHIKRTVG